jgi:hypothetical protein
LSASQREYASEDPTPSRPLWRTMRVLSTPEQNEHASPNKAEMLI